MLGFILGVAAGVALTAILQINYENKRFEEELEEMEKDTKEDNYEPFTYDCLNDPDPVEEEIDKHIPRIN